MNYELSRNEYISSSIEQQIAAIYMAVGIGESYHPDQIRRSYKNSAFYVFVKRDNLVIGTARVLSDDHETSWIAEIAVLPRYQRQGIGTAMMDAILAKYAHTAIYVDAVRGKNERFFSVNGIRPRQLLVSCARAPSLLAGQHRSGTH